MRPGGPHGAGARRSRVRRVFGARRNLRACRCTAGGAPGDAAGLGVVGLRGDGRARVRRPLFDSTKMRRGCASSHATYRGTGDRRGEAPRILPRRRMARRRGGRGRLITRVGGAAAASRAAAPRATRPGAAAGRERPQERGMQDGGRARGPGAARGWRGPTRCAARARAPDPRGAPGQGRPRGGGARRAASPSSSAPARPAPRRASAAAPSLGAAFGYLCMSHGRHHAKWACQGAPGPAGGAPAKIPRRSAFNYTSVPVTATRPVARGCRRCIRTEKFDRQGSSGAGSAGKAAPAGPHDVVTGRARRGLPTRLAGGQPGAPHAYALTRSRPCRCPRSAAPPPRRGPPCRRAPRACGRRRRSRSGGRLGGGGGGEGGSRGRAGWGGPAARPTMPWAAAAGGLRALPGRRRPRPAPSPGGGWRSGPCLSSSS
jgi:hypothetical protein